MMTRRTSSGILLALALACVNLRAGTYYVSTSGNDSYPGTLDSAFATIPKGVQVSVAGDTIYVRGGVYNLTVTVTLSKVGSDTARFHLFGYPGERPLLDFSSQAFGQRGVRVSGRYWHIRGIDIRKSGDNGMHVSGSNNVIEFCTFSENMDTGLQLSNGASDNQVINCDSYFNSDPGQGNADGFAPKLDVGTGNYFYGCRAWQNSDDGWDGYLRPSDDVTTTLENCWTFRNGYLMDGSPSTGNGNGFKMGGSDNQTLMHNNILKNCLAFDNRVKGFDQNNNKGSMTLYNCTGFRNGTNYSISQALNPGKVLTITNCAVLGSTGSIGGFALLQTNSWMPPFVVTTADFESIDTVGARGPRQPDGSLPDLPFLRLAQGSDLIDGGTDIGTPFNGIAPDLGAFEYDGPSSVTGSGAVPGAFTRMQNFPNPFNPETAILFSVAEEGWATLEVFDLLGQRVATLFDGPVRTGWLHRVTFDAGGLSSGLYLYRLQSGSTSATRTLSLLK